MYNINTLSMNNCMILIGVVIVLILIALIIYFLVKKCPESFSQTKKKKFKIPNSLTNVHYDKVVSKSTPENMSKETMDIIKNIIKSESKIVDGNRFNIPSFFYSNEKWPGCLPKALYQGSCGSCWGFAAVTCLSSRFYIESCGNTGCFNMPQLNLKGYNTEMAKINDLYKFRKIILLSIKKYIDINKNNVINLDEWIQIVEKFSKFIDIFDIKNTKQPTKDLYFVAEILVYMLDFQSMGSIKLYKNIKEITKRAKKTFYMLSDKGIIDLENWTKDLESQPILLSAEKIIACCENCKKTPLTNKKYVNDPICSGGTLINAWEMLRDVGTTTAICSGYNMDSWENGDPTPSCHVVLGPDYSYCSGYGFQLPYGEKDLNIRLNKVNEKLQDIEKEDIDPHTGSNIWPDPQLNRFLAKNAYEVDSKMQIIQKEISERGPVCSGFVIYPDFQESFSADGGGGQFYNGGNPLGGSNNSLVYMSNSKGKPLGGHAITIVGWGTYKYKKNVNIPYWICLNSWGIEWGTSGFPRYDNRDGLPENLNGGGYFWMVRGINNCGIEENVVTGQPNLEVITYPNTVKKYGWGLLPPSMQDITLIPPVEKNVFGDDRIILIGDQKKGGSIYIDQVGNPDKNVWKIKSMDPPSPFTFFWDEERPIFCLGLTTRNVSKDDKVIHINQNTIEGLEYITKVQKNPIFIINNEQIQFNQFENSSKSSIKVFRGINLTIPKDHMINSEIRVFPFRQLSYNYLKSNIKMCQKEEDRAFTFIQDILKN